MRGYDHPLLRGLHKHRALDKCMGWSLVFTDLNKDCRIPSKVNLQLIYYLISLETFRFVCLLISVTVSRISPERRERENHFQKK